MEVSWDIKLSGCLPLLPYLLYQSGVSCSRALSLFSAFNKTVLVYNHSSSLSLVTRTEMDLEQEAKDFEHATRAIMKMDTISYITWDGTGQVPSVKTLRVKHEDRKKLSVHCMSSEDEEVTLIYSLKHNTFCIKGDENKEKGVGVFIDSLNSYTEDGPIPVGEKHRAPGNLRVKIGFVPTPLTLWEKHALS